MNICAISDTHGQHGRVILPSPDTVDMIIHSGDISSRGTLDEIEAFLEWYEWQPHKYKVLIGGNHDFGFQDYPNSIRRMLKEDYPSIIYLEDSSVEIEGVKIWGSPWTPRFFDWAFNADRGTVISEHWKMIPEDTDIVVVHGPPYGWGDKVARGGINVGENVGCKDLLARLEQVKPKLCLFGHIHEGYGMYFTPDGETTYVNASVLDEHYFMVNDPIVFNYYNFV